MSPINIKSLADLERRRTPDVYELAELPKIVQWTSYAKAKANAISSSVRELYGSSYEWYGFTIANHRRPQLIVDIGLPENARNDSAYTRIESEQISRFCDKLPEEYLVNGWIHSHGRMGVFFSGTDERNHISVLDFVTTDLKIPVRKQEVLAEELSLLVEGKFSKSDMKEGTLTVVTDKPVGKAKVLETILGGFAYGMVIVDSGYTGQVIYYKYTSMLTQQEKVTFRDIGHTDIRTMQVEYPFGLEQKMQLMKEVKKKIKPDIFGGIWNKFRAPVYPVKTYTLDPQAAGAAKTPAALIPATIPAAGPDSKANQASPATLEDAVTSTPGEIAVDVNQIKSQPDPEKGAAPAADSNLQQGAAQHNVGVRGQTLEEMKDLAGMPSLYKVGDRVAIHPGKGGDDYDLGASIKTIPPGTQGIITQIGNHLGAEAYMELKLEGSKLKGESKWAVTSREVTLITPQPADSVEQQKPTADGQTAASKMEDKIVGSEDHDRIGDKSGCDDNRLENQ